MLIAFCSTDMSSSMIGLKPGFRKLLSARLLLASASSRAFLTTSFGASTRVAMVVAPFLEG